MEQLKMMGKQSVAGYEFTGIEGGFGKNKRSMLVKELAEIHNQPLKEINRRINDNRIRFKDGVDIIDLKVGGFEPPSFENLGYNKQSIANSKYIYLLSERGYAKLLKILEDDTAWELYDRFVDGYFSMRAEKKKQLSLAEDKTKETNAQARLLNAKTRQATLLLKATETFKESLSVEAKQSLVSHATRIVTGEMILSLPEVRKTYTASVIGRELGVSANLIGRLANKHRLKTDEYGIEVLDKSNYSNKQVPSFRYFENAKPILRELLA